MNKNKLCLLFLIVFSFLLYYIPAGITEGDAGELATTTFFLVPTHPPGYPIYELITKLFFYLPVGSVAFRLNFVSTFFASLSLVLIYILLFFLSALINKPNSFDNNKQKTSTNQICSLPKLSTILLPFIFLFSPIFLSFALTGEVYALSLFLLTLVFILFLNINFFNKTNIKLFFTFSFISGLLFVNNSLSLFYFLLFSFLIIKNNKNNLQLNFNKIIMSLIFFVLPFCCYVLIIIRGNSITELQRFNFPDVNSFLKYLGAQGFQELSLNFKSEIIILKKFLFDFISQFSFLGFFVIILGAVTLFKLQIKLFFIFLMIVLFILLTSLPATLSFDFYSFFFPVFLVFCCLFSVGLVFLQKIFNKNIAVVFVVLILILSFAEKSKSLKDRKEFTLDFYTKEVVKEVKNKSLIIAANSTTYYSFALLYKLLVEKPKKEIAIVFPMFFKNKIYLSYLKRKYTFIKIPENKKYNTATTDDFFKFVFSKYKLLNFLNKVSKGKIRQGIINHYDNLFLAKKLIYKSFSHFPERIYLLNMEIYETPGLNLKCFLFDEGYVYHLFNIYATDSSGAYYAPEVEFYLENNGFAKIFYSKIYLEKLKTANIWKNEKYAKEFDYSDWLKAKTLNPDIDDFTTEMQKNYRGISDFLMGEYLKTKNTKSH